MTKIISSFLAISTTLFFINNVYAGNLEVGGINPVCDENVAPMIVEKTKGPGRSKGGFENILGKQTELSIVKCLSDVSFSRMTFTYPQQGGNVTKNLLISTTYSDDDCNCPHYVANLPQTGNPDTAYRFTVDLVIHQCAAWQEKPWQAQVTEGHGYCGMMDSTMNLGISSSK